MATYSSHRLIMGKEEIDNFFCLIGDIWIFFYRNVYFFLSSPLRFIRLFVQIGEFDWLSVWQKGSIFVKMFKNLLLRNHKGDEAETWHTCLGHEPLQKLCFLFRLDKNSDSGCYGNL